MTFLLVKPICRENLQLDRFAVGYEGFLVNEGHRGIGPVISQMVFDVLDIFSRLPFVFGNRRCQRISVRLMGVVGVGI